MIKNIEWLKKEFDDLFNGKTILTVGRSVVDKILDQLDEPEVVENLIVPKPELPVIPKYVDEFIRNNRDKGRSLYAALSWLENGHKGHMRAYEWYRRNELDFVNAYLTGKYTVEKEQKYYIRDQHGVYLLAKNHREQGNVQTVAEIVEYYGVEEIELGYELTEEEIKGYDPRYMTFAKPIEELE